MQAIRGAQRGGVDEPRIPAIGVDGVFASLPRDPNMPIFTQGLGGGAGPARGGGAEGATARALDCGARKAMQPTGGERRRRDDGIAVVFLGLPMPANTRTYSETPIDGRRENKRARQSRG